ncbi:transcription factor MafB [Culicoides brevitarsis]|uniref:transcription factor MafB n=1 Tax=Culicoides brevitarsis TaxID=469753 RepID=UPI00307C033C
MEEHLADDYVQEFVLDHFDGVKKENNNNSSPPTAKLWNIPVDEESVPIKVKSSLQPWSAYPDPDRKMHSISPHAGDYPHVPMHGQPILINQIPSGAPSTPPETPPVSSPNHQSEAYSPYNHAESRQAGLMDGMMWFSSAMRSENPQPLDLRPLACSVIQENTANWDRKEYMHHASSQAGANGFGPQHHPSQYEHMNMHPSHVAALHHNNHSMNRPHSVSSTSSTISPRNSGIGSGSYSSICSDKSDAINDDLLMSLSVRELNKRLHGCPREEVVRLKQKRRTLKNRGYAQNCRSKRLQQRHDLEITNRHLHHELNKIKQELGRVVQERDHYKQKFMRTANLQAANGSNGTNELHSDESGSPEFYL